MAVVVFHAGRYVGGALPGAAWRWGEYGVDVFFVVSGFVMMVAVPRDAGWRDFALRRAVRILPMYWLATLLMASLVLMAPQLFASAVVTLEHVVSSVLLVPHYSPADGQIAPLLVPGWTLSYELYFYAVFALFLRFSPGLRIVGVACALLAISVAAALANGGSGRVTDASAIAQFLMREIVFEFVFGMLAGRLWLRGRRCDARLAWPLALGAMLCIAWLAVDAGSDWRLALVGGASFAMVWAMASAPRVPRLFAALGDASYSLYLLHPFVVGAVWFAWTRTGFAAPYVFVALCLVASAATGWIAWRVIERPMTRRLRRA